MKTNPKKTGKSSSPKKGKEVGVTPEQVAELKEDMSWKEMSEHTGLSVGKLRGMYAKFLRTAEVQVPEPKVEAEPKAKAKAEPRVKLDTDTINQIRDLKTEIGNHIKALKGNNRKKEAKVQILKHLVEINGLKDVPVRQLREIAVTVYRSVMGTKSKNFVHVFGGVEWPEAFVKKGGQ